jgi:D-alanyl-D-alanine carboxypeptidase
MLKHRRSLLVIAALLLFAITFFVVRKDRAAAPEPKNDSQSSTQQSMNNSQAGNFDKKRYSLDQADSLWVVVNKQRPLNPLQYAPADLMNVGSSQQLRQTAATALAQLIAAAKTEGLSISPMSGYRSYATQVGVYNNEVKGFGQAQADRESARPGYSEHQTGLAIDVGGGGCGIEDCFADTAEGKWLAAHAYEYGFIIRYPKGKENVTGYRYEPWHIRYVGKDLADEMHRTGALTLEEFFNLPAALNY